jgi:PD-(D/E)XK endonuclease
VSSDRRGNEAEAMVLSAFVRRGFEVLLPFGGGHPYDLVVDLKGQDFLRVQCKRAWPLKGGCLSFNAQTTDHGQGRRSYLGLADIFGVYFPPTEIVYLVPLDAVSGVRGWLRLEPTRNNQQKGVRFAADYEIDRWSIERLLEAKGQAEAASEPELNFA